MEIMKQKGYAVIDHDLIKTPEQIAKIKKAAKSISQFLIMWKSILNQVYPLKRLTDGYMKRLYGMGNPGTVKLRRISKERVYFCK